MRRSVVPLGAGCDLPQGSAETIGNHILVRQIGFRESGLLSLFCLTHESSDPNAAELRGFDAAGLTDLSFQQRFQGSSVIFRIFLGLMRVTHADTFEKFNQPTQSWKIGDATSAGSKRLTLSGLASRLHTIYAYTCPADAAAEQLVHLYVQKGHAASDCKRFLERQKKTALVLRSAAKRLCVCVSPSASKSSAWSSLQSSRGVRLPVTNLIQRSWVTGREVVEDAPPCTC